MRILLADSWLRSVALRRVLENFFGCSSCRFWRFASNFRTVDWQGERVYDCCLVFRLYFLSHGELRRGRRPSFIHGLRSALWVVYPTSYAIFYIYGRRFDELYDISLIACVFVIPGGFLISAMHGRGFCRVMIYGNFVQIFAVIKRNEWFLALAGSLQRPSLFRSFDGHGWSIDDVNKELFVCAPC